MMCGIAAIGGSPLQIQQIGAMVAAQRHRGPDAIATFQSSHGTAALGHSRLSIIDLSDAGRQPMLDSTGRLAIIFNGEIYNYRELRRELESTYKFRTSTDTEVLLAAYIRWGSNCLDRLLGMFAFVIWDEQQHTMFAVRDRFGVKPLYYHVDADNGIWITSEIKALSAAGLPLESDPAAWATYLTHGLYDHGPRTFWKGVQALPPGHSLTWRPGASVRVQAWYDVAKRVGEDFDQRPQEEVEAEYYHLLQESVSLRLRSDVPLGINLSGGLDSSLLLGLVQMLQEEGSAVKAFTFTTGHAEYDELQWAEQMLGQTKHESYVCQLAPKDVPELADSVQAFQDEPFGGLPTLAYARLFELARDAGVIVLLDGQGMDEQWAGYDYYRHAANEGPAPVIQGILGSPVRPQCLIPEFRNLAEDFAPPRPFRDALRNLQYRDIRHTKFPRVLRFCDRISMRASTELREPFLDHRLIELALRQPADRKIANGQGKHLLRTIATRLVPNKLATSPKRPVQTPQREWLRGPLLDWSSAMIDAALTVAGGCWLDRQAVQAEWSEYCRNGSDSSFYVWQWINLGLMGTSSSRDALPHSRQSLPILKSARWGAPSGETPALQV